MKEHQPLPTEPFWQDEWPLNYSVRMKHQPAFYSRLEAENPYMAKTTLEMAQKGEMDLCISKIPKHNRKGEHEILIYWKPPKIDKPPNIL